MKSAIIRRVVTAAILILLVPFSLSTLAAGSGPDSPSARKLDIKEITLENGLRIFVLERSAAPIFTGYYQFGVGGAADPKGRTGIAHLLEHMMFKGTETIGTIDPAGERPLMKRLAELWTRLDGELDRADDPFQKPDPAGIEALKREIETVTDEHKKLVVKNEYDELMTRAGGVSENASTGNDVTNYFIQLPANRLELWFRLESDRLLHPVFREFWSERDVVGEERRMSTENQAEGLVWEALEGQVFMAHPYRNPVLGWPHDVARLKQDDALAYFHEYYSPSNCVMVFVGDVKASEIERLARKYLGPWARQAFAAPVATTEPEQKGERRAVIDFDAQPSLFLAWRTVPRGHADQYALDVLARILGGLESSRFDRTIVQEERLASSVGSSHNAQKQGGYLMVSGYLAPGRTLAELEAAFDREIRKLQTDGVTAEELERAKLRAEISRVRSLKSNIGQAFRIGDAVGLAGTPGYVEEAEARLNAVTAADVQRVACGYLLPGRKCAVEVHKKPGASGASSEKVADVHHRGGEPGARGARHSTGFQTAMELIRDAPPLTLRVPEIGRDADRVVLENGVTVFIKEDHSAPSVEMNFTWLGGSNTTPVTQLAPFAVASRLLNEGGTEALEPMAFQEKKEQLGVTWNMWIGDTESGARLWSLSRNFSESFGLAMDAVMRPRFDPGRLETIKRQYIDEMRRRYDYPSYGSYLVGNHVLYHDNPRLGYEASRTEIQAVTPADIRGIWQRYLGRDNLYITAVGDFDKKEVLDLLQRTFAPWRTARDKQRDFLARDPVVRPGVYLVEKDVSAPSVAVIQQIRVDRTAPLADHAALEILNDILGGSGFRSRLMERLRSDEGLTYGIYSYLAHDARPGVPGQIEASYETKQVSVARSIDSVVEEFRKMVQGKVAAAEVQEQIDAWRNRFVFLFTNDFYSVSRLMGQELDDRPYDWDRRLLDAVQKVTPADVERVAAQYLRPEDLSICVFGTLTEADRRALEEKYKLTVLRKDEVFRGGFDEPAEAGSARPPASRKTFSGDWKLNVSRSTLPPPLPQSQIAHIEMSDAGIMIREEIVDDKGQALVIVADAKFDGGDYPVRGTPRADTVAYERVDERTIKGAAKKAGQVVVREVVVLSADGDTITGTYSFTDASGTEATATAVFERQ